jgi:mannose-6-phosphate isomerase-like protein (cupin superfamily)
MKITRKNFVNAAALSAAFAAVPFFSALAASIKKPGSATIEKKLKKGFKINIEKDTLENNNFRKVLYTSEHCQLVLMSLLPKQEIGEETHKENDQFFRFESGTGKVIIDGNEYDVKNGDAVIIPVGSKHNIINTSGTEKLKMYTIYSPPHHKDGIIRSTKEEAAAKEAEFDGETTE